MIEVKDEVHLFEKICPAIYLSGLSVKIRQMVCHRYTREYWGGRDANEGHANFEIDSEMSSKVPQSNFISHFSALCDCFWKVYQKHITYKM